MSFLFYDCEWLFPSFVFLLFSCVLCICSHLQSMRARKSEKKRQQQQHNPKLSVFVFLCFPSRLCVCRIVISEPVNPNDEMKMEKTRIEYFIFLILHHIIWSIFGFAFYLKFIKTA